MAAEETVTQKKNPFLKDGKKRNPFLNPDGSYTKPKKNPFLNADGSKKVIRENPFLKGKKEREQEKPFDIGSIIVPKENFSNL